MGLSLKIFGCALAMGLLPAGVQAQAKPGASRLDVVLAELDAASLRFHSARADFVSENYEAIVKETTSQHGITYFERNKGATEMGAVVMSAKKGPNGKEVPDKIVQYKNGTMQLFDTTLDQVRVMGGGTNQSSYQTFLTLGFGGSGRDLAKSWNITDLGSETLMDDGQPVKTEKLDLVSKDENVRNMYTHITIWVDTARDVTLRQVFDTPSHDRRTVNNSHIRLNIAIDKDAFAIKPGKHTTFVR